MVEIKINRPNLSAITFIRSFCIYVDPDLVRTTTREGIAAPLRARILNNYSNKLYARLLARVRARVYVCVYERECERVYVYALHSILSSVPFDASTCVLVISLDGEGRE